MIKDENIREDLKHSLPAMYICSRYRPKSADPERRKIELKQNIGRSEAEDAQRCHPSDQGKAGDLKDRCTAGQ